MKILSVHDLEDLDHFLAPYPVQTPIVLQPFVLKKLLGTRPLRRILVKTLLQECDERIREALGNRRAVILDNSKHYYQELNFKGGFFFHSQSGYESG